MQFLIEKGYKERQQGKWQKRMDTLELWKDYPLCECNDKLFLNINYFTHISGWVVYESYAMFLTHENPKGEWCNLEIYSLSPQQIIDNIAAYEATLMQMWELFYRS